MKDRVSTFFPYLLLVLLVSLPVFGHLDALVIRTWDEARNAINAIEMLENKNFIVTHYMGNPDMWNTKPPLLIWLQVGFLKFLGINELAVRLPSAIAAFFTCLFLLLFSKQYLNNFWLGFAAAMVLVTSPTYIANHASRTGDYDALLVLFTTISSLYFFAYCEARKNSYLYLFFLFSALAVLTKSITGLLFLPALSIYCLWRKQLFPTLKNKHFYFGLLAFILLVGSYYLAREYYNPGYLVAVQENELGGRYLNTLEQHQKGFWFYYTQYLKFQHPLWYGLVPGGIAIGFYSKNEQIKRLTIFSTIAIVCFFLVISAAQTKLDWYDLPLYPFLSILVAIFIQLLFDWLKKDPWLKSQLYKNVMPFIALFLLFLMPYQNILQKTMRPKDKPEEAPHFEITYYLRDAIKGQYDFKGQYLMLDGYQPQNFFYLKILNDQGSKIKTKHWNSLLPDDRAIAYQDHVKAYIEANYLYKKIYSNGNIVTYEIQQRKQ